jgi:ankyrin repeat protein
MTSSLTPPSVFEAAKAGDTEQLRALIADDPSLGVAIDTDGSAQTALHWAAFYGHADAVALLLGQGAAVIDARSADASTPLHRAAAAGHAAAVGALLECGADAEAEDDDGRTPLVQAAMLGAAQQAQAGGHAAVLGALLGHGAAAPSAVLVRERVLHWLASAGELDVLRAVLHRCGGDDEAATVLEARDRQGRTPLAVAAKAGHAESCAVLLEAGAALDPLDKAGASVYLCACFSGDAACERLLAQAGAATNATDKFDNDAQAYRSRNLRRSNDPPLETTAPPAGESRSEAGPAGLSCCRRLLCCLRRNRVHGDPLEAPLQSAVSASSGSGS